MNNYFLSSGSHATAADGRCAMEWVAYLAGEPHSDSPVCVCPVLRAFCVAFNDSLSDGQRQLLRPYLARTIGTAGDGLAEHRSWLATDWLIRVYTPTWLSLAGLDDAVGSLRSLPPVLATESLERAMGLLGAARSDAAAAWAAAWDAAGAAAGDAAGAAARAAARAAAWDAAWDAAGAAAWDAAGAAARAAARAAAGAAARDAAWDAAWDAAGAAAWDAWDAAWAAARDVLQPTVEELRCSAFDLLDRMLPTEVIQLPVVADADLVCGVVAHV